MDVFVIGLLKLKEMYRSSYHNLNVDDSAVCAVVDNSFYPLYTKDSSIYINREDFAEVVCNNFETGTKCFILRNQHLVALCTHLYHIVAHRKR